ncbi:MAG: hypothetical protein JO145_05630 [Acidobacteriaceae bacterium]|nr:hypothetical protein [Acidobacteriaceae bacterium]
MARNLPDLAAHISSKLKPLPVATTAKGHNMARRDSTEWYEEPPAIIAFVAAVFILIGYIAHEAIIHSQNAFTYGLDPFIKLFWNGASDFAKVLVAGIGAEAASITLISSIAIPITIVSTYTIFRKVEEKSKALIVAVSLFLDPLFIDFFKDKFGENNSLKKALIDASGVVTFLAASYFWSRLNADEAPVKKESKLAIFFLRSTAIILFLIPTLAMLGFIASNAHGDWNGFIHGFTPEAIIGLIGLIAVAAVGIGLSRYFEGP